MTQGKFLPLCMVKGRGLKLKVILEEMLNQVLFGFIKNLAVTSSPT